MITVRSLLARALAALLLLQWSGGPAHCLVTAAFSLDAGVICHAGAPGNPKDPGGGALSPDQVCPAGHALGHVALPPSSAAMPQRTDWLAAVSPPPPAPVIPVAPRAPPLQPRAPPATPA